MHTTYAKTAFVRALTGFPLGIMIGLIIVLIISYVLGEGEFYAVSPILAASFGSELNAVTLQFVLCGALGSCFAATSVLFEVETRGILWQTVVHFAITSVVMLSIAYTCHWLEPNLLSVAAYAGTFVAIYAVMWLAQMLYWRRRVAAINKRLD